MLTDFPRSVTKSNTHSDNATPNGSPRTSTAPSAHSSHGLSASASAHAVPTLNLALLPTPSPVRPALANDGTPNTSFSTIRSHAGANAPSPPISCDYANAHQPITEYARPHYPIGKLPTTPSALSTSFACTSPPPGSTSPCPWSLRDGTPRGAVGSDYEAPKQPRGA